jgi:hypothetical protein
MAAVFIRNGCFLIALGTLECQRRQINRTGSALDNERELPARFLKIAVVLPSRRREHGLGFGMHRSLRRQRTWKCFRDTQYRA